MRIDFLRLLRTAVASGLSPRAFWSLTPRELMALLGAGDAPPPFKRADLLALMRRYPDDRARGAET